MNLRKWYIIARPCNRFVFASLILWKLKLVESVGIWMQHYLQDSGGQYNNQSPETICLSSLWFLH